MAVIALIKRDTAKIIYAAADGVFIKDSVSGVYMLALDDFDKAVYLADNEGRLAHVCVYRRDVAEYLHKIHQHSKFAENVQAAYLKRVKVHTATCVRQANVRVLCGNDADMAIEFFANSYPADYITFLIENSVLFGGFLDEKLCGCIGIHAEGSMGLLKVCENNRRQGFGTQLAAKMVNTLLDRGQTPFAQIEYDNMASIALCRRLGFEISDKTLYRLID